MFLLKFIFFSLLNLILYISILRFLQFFKHKIKLIDRLIGGFVIHLTVLLGIYTVFGYLHLYEFKIITISIILLSTLFTTLRGNIKNAYREVCHDIKIILRKVFFHLKSDPFLLLLFSFLFLEFAILIRFTFLYPPQGWDSYTYHLPVASRIVIEKGFLSRNFLELNPYLMYFPKNGEIIFSFYYIFMGTDQGMSLIHLPFLVFGTLSIYSLLRKFNVSPEKSLYIFSLLLMPIIPNLWGCAYVDIETSFLFLIFLNFLVPDTSIGKILSLLCLSIACGTKWSFVPIFTFFIIVTSIKLLRNKKYFLFLFMITLSFLTSLHFYIYNFYLTGNPVYPYTLKFGKFKILPGNISAFNAATLPTFTYNPFIIIPQLFEFGRDDIYYYAYHNIGAGFGHIFLSFGIIPFLIFVYLCIRDKNFQLLNILFYTILYYFTAPYRWYPRFHIYLPFLFLFSTIYLWERWKQKNLKVFILVLCFFSFIEGLHDRLITSPYSQTTSYEENTFELLYIPQDIKQSYSKISFYLKEKDKIGVLNSWALSNPARNLIGLLLRNGFLISIEAVLKNEDIEHYNKILSSPEISLKGYKKIYSDKNLSLWIK